MPTAHWENESNVTGIKSGLDQGTEGKFVTNFVSLRVRGLNSP